MNNDKRTNHDPFARDGQFVAAVGYGISVAYEVRLPLEGPDGAYDLWMVNGPDTGTELAHGLTFVEAMRAMTNAIEHDVAPEEGRQPVTL